MIKVKNKKVLSLGAVTLLALTLASIAFAANQHTYVTKPNGSYGVYESGMISGQGANGRIDMKSEYGSGNVSLYHYGGSSQLANWNLSVDNYRVVDYYLDNTKTYQIKASGDYAAKVSANLWNYLPW